MAVPLVGHQFDRSDAILGRKIFPTVTIRPEPYLLCRFIYRKCGKISHETVERHVMTGLGIWKCRNTDLGLGTSPFPTSLPDFPDIGSEDLYPIVVANVLHGTSG